MNTANYNDVLKAAASEGEIDLLYTVIVHDPFVLEHIDSIPFVETPLHIAAFAGHVHFAIEVMRLKPSYAYKLNHEGFSPIHRAMQRVQELTNQQGAGPNDFAKQMGMVLRLVEIDKNLVRVKGREGITPLHFATQNGQVDLLANFLDSCPDSIEDVNARGETALHVAAENDQNEALEVLVGWLKTSRQKIVIKSEKIILDWKDEAGNTALHISMRSNNLQALQLLLKAKINLNTKNLENLTALDMPSRREMKDILLKAGAKPSSEVGDFPTLAQKLRSSMTTLDKAFIYIIRSRRDLSDQQRDAVLIVVTLLITATFQTSLSPPGGVFQAEANPGDTNVNQNATVSQQNVGKSVMPVGAFIGVFSMSFLTIISSIMAMSILIPTADGLIGELLTVAIIWFFYCYIYNVQFISPTSTTLNATFDIILYGYAIFVILVGWTFHKGSRRLDGAHKKW